MYITHTYVYFESHKSIPIPWITIYSHEILLPSPYHNCVPIPSVWILVPKIINTYTYFLNPIIQYSYSCFRISLSTLLKSKPSKKCTLFVCNSPPSLTSHLTQKSIYNQIRTMFVKPLVISFSLKCDYDIYVKYNWTHLFQFDFSLGFFPPFSSLFI